METSVDKYSFNPTTMSDLQTTRVSRQKEIESCSEIKEEEESKEYSQIAVRSTDKSLTRRQFIN